MNDKASHPKTVLIWIVVAGAVGGVAANISVFGEPTVLAAFSAASWFKYVLIPMLLGALAAGIGVYVLTKADTTDLIRTFFFAVICGLAFPQIIDNAKRTVSGQAVEEATARALNDSARELQGLATHPNTDAAAINDVAARMGTLAARVSEPAQKQEAVNALQNAATTLTEPSDKAATVQVITDIGSDAAGKKDYATTLWALKALGNVEKSAQSGVVKDQVAKAQGELVMQFPESLRWRSDVVATIPPESSDAH